MEFQEIFANRTTVYVIIACISMLVGLVLVILGLSFICDEGVSAGFIISIIVGAGIIVGSVIAFQQWDDTEKSNEAALISNIEQKYDVDDVLLDAPDANVNEEDTRAQNVSVVVDSNVYTFLLTQDINTWEPTLINLPVPGGSSDTMNLSADDLLK